MIVDTLPNGLRDLQTIGAIAGWQDRAKIFADQPGAGKTLQVEFAVELDGQFTDPAARILITAPKTACQLMWARELETRIASQYDVVIADLTGPCGSKRKGGASVAERNTYLGQCMVEAHDRNVPLIVLTNFEGLRWVYGKEPKLANLWQNRWSAVIIDESHLVLPTTSDDPKKFTQFWYGLHNLVTTPRCLRFAMSGTPDNGKLENRFGTYRFIYPQRFSSYWGWVKHFFYTKPGQWGGLVILGLRKEREAEWQSFQATSMIRRTKAEMLKGLPPKQFINVPLALHEDQRARYDEYETKTRERIDELLELDTEQSRAEARTLEFTAALRLRQLSICDWYGDQEGKWHAKGNRETSVGLDWVCEFLSERGFHEKERDDTLGKVVITSYLVEVLEWMQVELEKEGYGRIPILSGQTPLEEKQRIEAQFQRGELRCILFSGHIGVSISLDAADDMVFADLVHDPDKMEQTEDRIHRASSSGVKQFWRLVGEDTIMEEILKANDERYRVTRKSYDGARGVDFRRKMMKQGAAA